MLFFNRMCVYVIFILCFHVVALAANSNEKSITPIYGLLLSKNIFASDLALGPDTIFSGKASDVVAAISLKDATSDEEIELWQSSKSGALLHRVAILKDNGNADTGDYLLGDGIFHGKFSLTPSDPGKNYYRAIYKGKTSIDAHLTIVPELSDASLNAASSQADTAKSIYDGVVNGGGSPKNGQDAVQSMLASESNILQYGKASDDYGSWWITDEGIIVVHNPLVDRDNYVLSGDQVSCKNGRQESVTIPVRPIPKTIGNPLLPKNKVFSGYFPYGLHSIKLSMKASDNSKRIGSKDALVLDMYDFTGWDNSNPHIASVLDDYGMDVTRIVEGSLNDLKNLSQYGVVSIISHGSSYFASLKSTLFGLIVWWGEEWGQLNEGGWPTISTPLDETDAMKADIAAGRLAVTGSGKVAILPSFILHYNKDLPDTIVLMSICQGAYNDKLGRMFTHRGASAFFGYSDTVLASFAKTHGEGLFDHLVQDKTAGTYSGIGENDGDDTPAELKLIGNGDIKLIDPSKLENGDFESGTLNSWSPVGDVRVVQKLQTLNTPHGTYMALLSTGIGAEQDSTSLLSQKIRPSTAKHTLKFRYNFVSEEPLEFVGSDFDDKFDLIIDTNVTTVESVNAAEWKELGGDYFQGGDSTTYQTGWQEKIIDLGSNIGSLINLKFRVSDVGDSAFDSAVLIDNIRLE